MDGWIKIDGKDDKGPWTIKRIEGTTISRKETAHRFGVLADYVRDFVKSQDKIYNLEYMGENRRIFEEPEERVLFCIVHYHNSLVRLKRDISRII